MQTPPPHYYVYIFGSPASNSIKVGIAGDLQKQLQQIDEEVSLVSTSTLKEKPRLVYYEHYEREEIALNREREIVKGGDATVHRLIESMNPNWLDLSDMIS